MRLHHGLDLQLPIIQAPMAGVQDGTLAVAVSEAGGLGSLPCAMLTPDGMGRELLAITASTARPFNVNFFCHSVPPPDAERDAAWRRRLAPYYAEFGVTPAAGTGVTRLPFGEDALRVVAEFKPPIVRFHFGLPSSDLLNAVKSYGAVVWSSATTIAEARWLEAHGADCIIAQGLEAGGHRGHSLSDDLTKHAGTAPVHRTALIGPHAHHTAVTNLFSGRPARGIVNRLMGELGPLSHDVPPFPRAAAGLAPLRAAAEARGQSRPSLGYRISGLA